MKRCVSFVVVSAFLLFWAVSQLIPGTGARPPQPSPAPQSSPAAPAAAGQPPRPNDAGSVAAQLGPAAQRPLDCQGCHTAGQPPPYLGGAQFHTAAHAAYDANVHARAVAAGKKGANCLDCHSPDGRQESIRPSSDPTSTTSRANVSKTCAKCHERPAQTFTHSIHGLGQSRGISVAATCSDCHGAHEVFPAGDARSLLSKQKTPTTCGKCHQPIISDFEMSSHHEALARGNERAPACTTCHTSAAHADAPVSTRDFSLETVNQCLKCHAKQSPSYRDTFHGQATALGFKPAATCADCHTPHRNLPSSDPRSSVHPTRLVETCGRCHQNVNANFVQYDPHPEPTDPDRSLLVYSVHTFMKWLFVFVFGFFGIHTLLWLQRSVAGVLRGETRRHRDGEQWVVRFNKSNRATHVAIVVSFLVLAATGLPLMYYYTGWGQTLAAALGGVGLTRVLHRIFAVVTFGYAFYHLGYLFWQIVVRKERGLLYGPDSMVPRPKDLADMREMFRWFFYRRRRPPRFDRWTYWEKFDYFAVFWGVPVIGLSGLLLWLPGFFSTALPGSVLNVAMIVHGEEALLATGFIFAFHFFHNHMRPENFPLDTVVFTGKLPLERFKEERPREYKRLRKEGRLGQILTDPPSPRARLYASLFGYTAYVVGLVLVVAIFYSLIFK